MLFTRESLWPGQNSGCYRDKIRFSLMRRVEKTNGHGLHLIEDVLE